MRRFLALAGVVMALAGFVLIFLSIRFNIPWFIPIGLILGAFLLLLLLKRISSDTDTEVKQNHEQNEDPEARSEDR